MFLTNIISSVFRPSVAAMSISLAVAIVSMDDSSRTVSSSGTINLSQFGCSGLLKPACQSLNFFR